MKTIALGSAVLALLVGVSDAAAQEGRIFETLPPTTADPSFRENILRTTAGILDEDVNGRARAWLPLSKLWGPGAVLRVCFLNGDTASQSYVARTANEWNQLGADIRLDFGQLAAPRRCNEFSQAQIRVSFNQQSDNSSFVGRDALVNAPGWRSSSMDLDINDIYADGGNGIILHEFGHALGLYHEHQRPGPEGCEDEFDWPAVFEYFLESHGWSRTETWNQVGPRRSGRALRTTELDPTSIMMYQFPRYVFHDGANSYCYIARATDAISRRDAEALIEAYTDETWEIRNELLEQSAAAAASQGNMVEARHIAVYAIELDELNAIAEAYDQEGVLGFNPPPEAQAQTLLEDRITRYLSDVSVR